MRPRKVWFDDTVQRLNVDGRGELLGEFKPNDRLLVITQSGKSKNDYSWLSTHFEEDMIVLEKWNKTNLFLRSIMTEKKERYYVKRF